MRSVFFSVRRSEARFTMGFCVHALTYAHRTVWCRVGIPRWKAAQRALAGRTRDEFDMSSNQRYIDVNDEQLSAAVELL